MEMDLVAHCGNANRGSFVHSLVLTDVASGWTEAAPIVVREGSLVVETVERIRGSLPFPLRALDVDNGSEFVNNRLIEYCLAHGIELTRSRPYRKNDQAWIEQKNGAVVRKLLGYRRFEGLTAARAITRLYAASRLFVNFFQPSFKLAEKHRDGAKVTKRYHPPQTPCERLLQADSTPEETKAKLSEVAAELDPLKLLEEIRAVQAYLAALADGEVLPTATSEPPNLAEFIASLTSAWRGGEIRPTFSMDANPRYLRGLQKISVPSVVEAPKVAAKEAIQIGSTATSEKAVAGPLRFTRRLARLASRHFAWRGRSRAVGWKNSPTSMLCSSLRSCASSFPGASPKSSTNHLSAMLHAGVRLLEPEASISDRKRIGGIMINRAVAALIPSRITGTKWPNALKSVQTRLQWNSSSNSGPVSREIHLQAASHTAEPSKSLASASHTAAYRRHRSASANGSLNPTNLAIVGNILDEALGNKIR
jgi:hypothetical protein